MKKQLLLSTVLAFGVMQIGTASGAAHWTYEGNEGPANWGTLSHDYSMCKEGKQQSPIDITNAIKAKLGGIKFSYKSGPKEILNNGHTIQVNMNKGSSITVNGKKYNLLQFHFHSPSEHTVNGKPADMVMHLVHQAADGQLGVIGVLMKKGNPNKTLASLWKKMPRKAGDKNVITGKINVKNLLPAGKAYYNYSGSSRHHLAVKV